MTMVAVAGRAVHKGIMWAAFSRTSPRRTTKRYFFHSPCVFLFNFLLLFILFIYLCLCLPNCSGSALQRSIALHGNPCQSYGASLAIWDHSVTCHPTQVNMPRHNPANQHGTRFTYPWGMEGWVDLGNLTASWPGIKPTTSWLQVWRPNRYATKLLFGWHGMWHLYMLHW